MGEPKRTPANKGKRYPVEILTPHEVRALLRACSSRAPSGIRNQALITTGRRGDAWDVLSNASGGVMFACVLLWLRTGNQRALWVVVATLPVALASVAGASGVI